jgi:hypothetical protein
MTTYTLVQADTDAPTVDQLKRAFAFTDCLRAPDAAKLAHEACGILLKHLSYDNAYRVHCALKEDGVATEILDSAALPPLPDSRLTRRLELSDPALLVYDVLGRATPVEWNRLDLIAAGAVGHFEVNVTHTEERVMTFSPLRGFHPKTVSETQHVLETERQLLLELLTEGGERRFHLEAKGFLFGYCFNRPELGLEEKFGLLARLILERAPHALRNRGAEALARQLPVVEYASKAALHDEIVWWRWHRQRTAGASGSHAPDP